MSRTVAFVFVMFTTFQPLYSPAFFICLLRILSQDPFLILILLPMHWNSSYQSAFLVNMLLWCRFFFSVQRPKSCEYNAIKGNSSIRVNGIHNSNPSSQNLRHTFFGSLKVKRITQFRKPNQKSSWPNKVTVGLYNTPTVSLYLSPNECPECDTKLSDSEAPILELWRMKSTPSLPLPPGPLWPRVEAPDRALSMGQIELFDI